MLFILRGIHVLFIISLIIAGISDFVKNRLEFFPHLCPSSLRFSPPWLWLFTRLWSFYDCQ